MATWSRVGDWESFGAGHRAWIDDSVPLPPGSGVGGSGRWIRWGPQQQSSGVAGHRWKISGGHWVRPWERRGDSALTPLLLSDPATTTQPSSALPLSDLTPTKLHFRSLSATSCCSCCCSSCYIVTCCSWIVTLYLSSCCSWICIVTSCSTTADWNTLGL